MWGVKRSSSDSRRWLSRALTSSEGRSRFRRRRAVCRLAIRRRHTRTAYGQLKSAQRRRRQRSILDVDGLLHKSAIEKVRRAQPVHVQQILNVSQ